MQHAMLIPEIHEFSMLVKMRQRARSLDAFSHLYRDFQYRLISTYTFSESSRHSEHNDMRQGYVLINRLGCRAPWRVRWRHPHVRGRKKLSNHFTALHPRYSYSGGSPGLGTTGKFRPTFIENRTPARYRTTSVVGPLTQTKTNLSIDWEKKRKKKKKKKSSLHLPIASEPALLRRRQGLGLLQTVGPGCSSLLLSWVDMP